MLFGKCFKFILPILCVATISQACRTSFKAEFVEKKETLPTGLPTFKVEVDQAALMALVEGAYAFRASARYMRKLGRADLAEQSLKSHKTLLAIYKTTLERSFSSPASDAKPAGRLKIIPLKGERGANSVPALIGSLTLGVLFGVGFPAVLTSAEVELEVQILRPDGSVTAKYRGMGSANSCVGPYYCRDFAGGDHVPLLASIREAAKEIRSAMGKDAERLNRALGAK